MKYHFSLLAFCMAFFAVPSGAFAKVYVFACEPEWAALSEELGGDLVEVYTASKAHEDVHHMRAKPSLLVAMRKADLVFCSGASLESAWLPPLLKKAGREDVQQNSIGWMMASDFVRKLDVGAHTDHRHAGHVHSEGNPHVHLNPHNVIIVAEVLAERLFLLDQDNGDAYQEQYAAFKDKWRTLVADWETRGAILKGRDVVVYHKNWAYLADWLGMNVVASLEPKEGLPPTAGHIERVLQSIDGRDVVAILVAPFEKEEAAGWLSERAGIPVLRLPYTVGGSEDVNTLERLFDETLSLLGKAVQ